MQFYSENFMTKAKEQGTKEFSDPFEKLFSSPLIEEGFDEEGAEVRMAFLLRMNRRAKAFAHLLFDATGKIDWSLLKKAKEAICRHRYFLHPSWLEESEALRHLEKMVDFLEGSKEAKNLIDHLSKPYQNPMGEKMVRLTLGFGDEVPFRDAEVKEAVLAALFSYLRQTVGSCFATAVAIFVKEENPLQFLQDIEEILSRASLRRIREGKEYIVPMAMSPGTGDLKRPLFIDLTKPEEVESTLQKRSLLVALTKAKILSEKEAQERPKEFYRLLAPLFKKASKGYFWTDADTLLREAIKNYFGLDDLEASLSEEEKKPWIAGDLLLVSPQALSIKRKAKPKEQFKKAVKIAQESYFSDSYNALLKCWEYTIASFAETKREFSSWNLYQSLGIDPKEPFGIGSEIQKVLQDKLDQSNRKIEELQIDYEFLYGQLKAAEARMRAASDEKEIQWIRADYQAKRNEFSLFEELRNKEANRGKRMASLYNEIIERALQEFPDFFQEVYDPEMEDVKAGFFDDRPAGFRLIVKEGRRSQAYWRKVESAHDFGEALAQFFSTLETILKGEEVFLGLEEDLSDLITTLILFLRSDLFLESAIDRMAKAHGVRSIKNPLQNLDKIEKKPWAYTSGGSLHTLFASYFALVSSGSSESDRWVENETELALFLIDFIKRLDWKKSEPLLQAPTRSLLIHSPTHAFLFQPGRAPFSQCCQSEQYSYTYLRDYYIQPMERFYETLFMREEELDFLISEIGRRAKSSLKEQLIALPSRFGEVMNPRQLYRWLTEHRMHGQESYFGGDMEIASLLFSLLPLCPYASLEERMRKLLEGGPFEDCLQAMVEGEWFSRELPYYSGKELISMAFSLIIKKRGVLSIEENPYTFLVERARRQEWIPPPPLVFADTNWPGYYFSFLVSPASSKLELWRSDSVGLHGFPMAEWKEWLDGSKKSPTWGVLAPVVPVLLPQTRQSFF